MSSDNEPHAVPIPAAKKSLGQHFLRDRQAIARIVAAVPEHTSVLEIGPGPGALTKHLIGRARRLTLIEADDRFATCWAKRASPCLHVVHADVLDVLETVVEQQRPEWIVGNLPYNISGPLTARLAALHLAGGMVLMYQREVAERLLAAAGDKARGGLSVLVHHHYDVQRLLVLSPGAFVPSPKVYSVVLLFAPRTEALPCGYASLQKAVRQGFAHRRKTLANNFRGQLTAEDWYALDIDAGMRPQELDDLGWARLASRLAVCRTYEKSTARHDPSEPDRLLA